MKKFILTALLVIASATAANAEVFVWKDATYDIKVTYPDNWMRQAQLDEDLRLFILAPQGMDHAACRLYASHDGRYMDAPAYAGSQVSAFVFDNRQLVQEMYNRPDAGQVQLVGYSPNGSLGNAAAVMAEFNFQKNWANSVYPMHAMAVATQYAGHHIFMTCETLASAWPRWEASMKSIFKSVTFPAAYAIEPNGLYRRFQDDGEVYLPLNRRKDGYTTR